MSRLLVIATRNPHKMVEIRSVLEDLDVELRGCADFPGCPDVVEDGATLEANATKKAREVCEYTREWTLADDTGLEVDALGGAPGVYSARWAGPDCTYDDNNDKLLRELASVPHDQRTARFRCVMALALPATGRGATSESAIELFAGRLDGRIASAKRGAGGFGYDPLFEIRGAGCTLAELPAPRKNQISHRGRALQAFRTALQVRLSSSVAPGGRDD